MLGEKLLRELEGGNRVEPARLVERSVCGTIDSMSASTPTLTP